jgi:integrase
VLISSGLRPIEAASLRLMDLDNKILPTKVTVRKEYSKTRRSRIVYISDEAVAHLQTLLKYRKNELQQDTLIFSVQKDSKSPATIYFKLLQQFTVLQQKAGLDQRKEGSRRHKITLHSFRRTCFSIITQQTNSEYANYILGHSNSPYWTHTEQERRDIYRTKCMPYLTVLDYSALDTHSKNIETNLLEKDRKIADLAHELAELAHELGTVKGNLKKLTHLDPEISKIINESLLKHGMKLKRE